VHQRTSGKMNKATAMASPVGDREDDDASEIRVAFLGNSILYFNDCPRVLERMLETRLLDGSKVVID
jgi:hypothetical protein